jgi:DNA replication initiation complex subunit (GINS family)
MTEISLERLEEVLRKERESEGLTDIERGFFDSAHELFERLSGSDDFFVSKKREVTQRYFAEIVTIRAEKIFSGKREFTLPEEHKLIKLSEEIRQKKAEIIAELLSPTKEARIKVNKPIPRFVGPDMKTYGPYETGQVITLSSRIVSLLLIHDYVEKVNEI